ncbi:hypothetical protein [Magnetospirillum molischianum]|uniref:Uncharacterized protein n=1 Tax=Magnetospirillum molischianum DSM 120 TaxID=1150626 RepID=H8FXD3_MAGML|nr:hypothetical protein [Magnetospirillum molischianum]CCG43021.1 hypothetical protein PHAMO_570016 [Magnetospirillum molischianum DSM 120]
MRSSEQVESRAIHILLSARAVAEDMEQFRHHLTVPDLPPAVTDLLTEELEDATSRLSNLISLAIAEINHSSDSKFRNHFDALLTEVRGRWVRLHLKKIAARLAYIDRQATDTLSSGIYRLGLARRLEAAYSEVRTTLVAMGALDTPGLESTVLNDVQDKITALAELENTTFRLLDLDRESGRQREQFIAG